DGDQPDHAGVALVPLPRKALEGAALARDFIEISADILDGRNTSGEQRLVCRIPLGKVIDRLAAGRLLVFGQEIFDLRPVAMGAKQSGECTTASAGAAPDVLPPLLPQPLRRTLGQAGRVAEIFLTVGIAPVPAGIDQHDVVGCDSGHGLLEIGWLDLLPFALW